MKIRYFEMKYFSMYRRLWRTFLQSSETEFQRCPNHVNEFNLFFDVVLKRNIV